MQKIQKIHGIYKNVSRKKGYARANPRKIGCVISGKWRSRKRMNFKTTNTRMYKKNWTKIPGKSIFESMYSKKRGTQ